MVPARPRVGRGSERVGTGFRGAVSSTLRARSSGDLRVVAWLQDSNTAPLALPLGGPPYGVLFPLVKQEAFPYAD